MPRCPRPLAAAVSVLLAMSALPTVAVAAEAPLYREPVDAPLVDVFREPAAPYGPGNRGWQYDTEPGQAALSAADGIVLFAGQVGGTRHVSVGHADGLRTSYSFLATVAVRRGDRVERGTAVGTTGELFHFGVRDDDGYVDPASILQDSRPAPRLVPLDDWLGRASPGTEVSDLTQVVEQLRRGHRLGGGGLGGLLGQALSPSLELLVGVSPVTRGASALEGLRDWWGDRGSCTPASVAAPEAGERRIAVLVSGLGSTSRHSSVLGVDTEALGYDAGDVVVYSYRGGRVPGTGGALAGIDERAFGSTDSQQDLGIAGDRLVELLDDVATAAPGVPIDVFAHSQGGVVAQVALVSGAQTDVLPTELRTVVTMGSPHGGADLATVVVAVEEHAAGRLLLDEIGERTHLDVDPASPAVQQLAESSELMAALDGAELAEGVRVLTLSARGDLVVPAQQSRLDGAEHHVLDIMGASAHGAITSDAGTTREIALVRGGWAPTCESFGDAVLDIGVGEGIGFAEDLIGVLALPLLD